MPLFARLSVPLRVSSSASKSHVVNGSWIPTKSRENTETLPEADRIDAKVYLPACLYKYQLCVLSTNVHPRLHLQIEFEHPSKFRFFSLFQFEDIFSPYSRYCSDQTNCQEYCRDQDRHNEIFKAYLAWCETQKDCNRLRLLDILVRPMQRLTKYSLLLKAILKKTEDQGQRDNLIVMDEKVDSFVSDVNSHLRQRQENERLKTIIARIESYEPVETKDEDLDRLVQSHCRLDLTAPMPGCSEHQRRYLLYEGDLKLKEGLASKVST